MPDLLTATVQLPGSCGELVQGSYEGIPFHVTCPIDIYASIRVDLSNGTGKVYGPERAEKACRAASATLQCLGRHDLDARLSIESPLPPGKGMASSTADVAGAILATAEALGAALDPGEVAKIALSIEPTDGTFLPGIVVFDHRGGRMRLDLGPPPPIEIVVLDFGGEVDTIAFNRQERSEVLRRLEPRAGQALDLVKQGLAQRRAEWVGEAATISALANQEVLYKPQLERVMSLARHVGALGVNVAHSGTVIGVLLDPHTHDAVDVADFMQRNLPGLESVHTARLVGGGPRSPVAASRQSRDTDNQPNRAG